VHCSYFLKHWWAGHQCHPTLAQFLVLLMKKAQYLKKLFDSGGWVICIGCRPANDRQNDGSHLRDEFIVAASPRRGSARRRSCGPANGVELSLLGGVSMIRQIVIGLLGLACAAAIVDDSSAHARRLFGRRSNCSTCNTGCSTCNTGCCPTSGCQTGGCAMPQAAPAPAAAPAPVAPPMPAAPAANKAADADQASDAVVAATPTTTRTRRFGNGTLRTAAAGLVRR